MWVLPNKKGYLTWMHRTFHTENYENSPGRMKTYQRIVKDYMKIQGPYRGLLLYHGLGTGKTSASIAASEGFLTSKFGAKIIIALPASLEKNYLSEIKKFASIFDKRRKWIAVPPTDINGNDAKRLYLSPKFMKQRANDEASPHVWIPHDSLSLIDKYKEADEAGAEPGISYYDLDDAAKVEVDKTMDVMIAERYIFLHYNGNIDKELLKLQLVENLPLPSLRWVSIPNNDTTRSFVKSILDVKPNKAEFIFLPEQFLDGSLFDKVRPGDVKLGVAWSSMSEKEQNETTALFNAIINRVPDLIKLKVPLKRNVLDNAFIVIDEVHNFINSVSSEAKTALPFYNALMKARNAKMVLLSGTPVINHPHEMGLLINLIKGPIVFQRFVFPDGVILPTIEEIMEGILSVKRPEIRELISVTDTIEVQNTGSSNGTGGSGGGICISFVPYGFKRAEESSNFYIKRAKWTWNQGETLSKYANAFTKYLGMPMPEITQEVRYAFPNVREEFSSIFLDERDPMRPAVINRDLFIRRAMGTISYFRSEGMADTKPTEVVRVIMPEKQFTEYIKVRDGEIKAERRRAVSRMWGSDTSTYRTFSRQVSNFAFPQSVKRMYPTDFREIAANADQTHGNFSTKKDQATQAKIKYEGHVREIIDRIREDKTPLLAYDKGTGVWEYSAKFGSIYNDIKDPELKGPVLLYSEYRQVEGLALLEAMLIANGMYYLQIRKNKNGEYDIVPKLNIAGVDGGTYEGGIFAKEYDHKRFIKYPTQGDEARVLLDLFNGRINDYPIILQKFKEHRGLTGEISKTDDVFLRGGFCKVMMISSSASEGISLRNIRRVLITEPFWNMSRISQVIGRAVRMGSHSDLEEHERVVDVKLYLSTFDQSQQDNLQKNQPTIWKNDQRPKVPGKIEPDRVESTDEHIYNLAKNKDNVSQEFLKMLQQGSIDCVMNAPKNNPGMTKANQMHELGECYQFPENDDPTSLSSVPDIHDDILRVNQDLLMTERRKVDTVEEVIMDHFIGFKPAKDAEGRFSSDIITFFKINNFNQVFVREPNGRLRNAYDGKIVPADVTAQLLLEIAAKRVEETQVIKKYIRINGKKDIFDYNAYYHAGVLRPGLPPRA